MSQIHNCQRNRQCRRDRSSQVYRNRVRCERVLRGSLEKGQIWERGTILPVIKMRREKIKVETAKINAIENGGTRPISNEKIVSCRFFDSVFNGRAALRARPD